MNEKVEEMVEQLSIITAQVIIFISKVAVAVLIAKVLW